MPDRLSPLDASFLFAEHRTAAMHVGAVMTFAPPERGPFDAGRLRRADRPPAAAGAAVPAEGPRRARPPRAAGVGRRPGLRPGLPRAALGVARARHRGGAARAGRAAAGPPARPVPPAVGGLPDRGAGRRPVRGGHQDPPRDGRRAGLDGHRGGAARPHPAAAGDPARRLASRRRSRPRWSWPRTPCCTRCAGRGTCSTWPGGRCPTSGRRCRRSAGSPRRCVAAGRSAAAVRPVPPLTAATGEQRRYGMERTTLADHRAVRKAHGGTVNDVVLAVVAGALRRWMISRGEPLTADVVGARAGPGERAGAPPGRRRRQQHLGLLRRPAGGRAGPGAPAGPGPRRHGGAQARAAGRSAPRP